MFPNASISNSDALTDVIRILTYFNFGTMDFDTLYFLFIANSFSEYFYGQYEEIRR